MITEIKFNPNVKLFNYFRMVGKDAGGSKFMPFREGVPLILLRGDDGRDHYITESKLLEIMNNPPTHKRIQNALCTLTYDDRDKAGIWLVLQNSVERSKLRFV